MDMKEAIADKLRGTGAHLLEKIMDVAPQPRYFAVVPDGSPVRVSFKISNLRDRKVVAENLIGTELSFKDPQRLDFFNQILKRTGSEDVISALLPLHTGLYFCTVGDAVGKITAGAVDDSIDMVATMAEYTSGLVMDDPKLGLEESILIAQMDLIAGRVTDLKRLALPETSTPGWEGPRLKAKLNFVKLQDKAKEILGIDSLGKFGDDIYDSAVYMQASKYLTESRVPDSLLREISALMSNINTVHGTMAALRHCYSMMNSDLYTPKMPQVKVLLDIDEEDGYLNKLASMKADINAVLEHYELKTL